MCDWASVTSEPEPRDTGARVVEIGDSHQYSIISDIREGLKKKQKKWEFTHSEEGPPPSKKLEKTLFLSSSGLAQALRLNQAHSGSYSGSLRLLLSDSDSDPEPGLTLKSCRPPPLPPTTHPPPNF